MPRSSTSRRAVSLSAVAVLLLAGCVQGPTGDKVERLVDDGVGTDALAHVPPTGAGAVGFLDSFVMTHPDRHSSDRAAQATARDDLALLLEGFGLRVERQAYSGTGTNILAFQNGTTRPDEWVVLSAHYDSGETSGSGAWDNGAGVAAALEIARSVATRPGDRTVVVAFFDEQERGGRAGSSAFVERAVGDATLVANLNIDGAGMTWPCRDERGYLTFPVVFPDAKESRGVGGYPELREAVVAAMDAAGVPPEVRDHSSNAFQDARVGDHQSFDAVDVPNAWFTSDLRMRAGPASVPVYPLHTPFDTADRMAEGCGGRDLMTQAFHATVVTLAGTLDVVDRWSSR